MYAKSSAVDDSLYGINVPYLVNLSTIIRIESNSVLIMGFLDSGSFITKFNKTKLYALSGTYNNYNSPYDKYLGFLSFNIYTSIDIPLLTSSYVESSSIN